MLGLMLGLVPVIFLGLMARMHGSECRDILGKESASLSASAPLSGLSAPGAIRQGPGTRGSLSEPGWLPSWGPRMTSYQISGEGADFDFRLIKSPRTFLASCESY